jgi:hypothetical protein
MRTTNVALLVITIGSATASAQPGALPADPAAPPTAPPTTEQVAPPATPYGPPMAPPPPYAPPPYGQAVVPPPYGYQPQVALTAEDRDLLASGEISDEAHVGGGIAAIFVGFGVGQAIQGRWTETGWIYTLGETVASTAFTIGLVEQFTACVEPALTDRNCSDRGVTPLVLGMLGVVGFRVAGSIDAFVAPPRHNERVRRLKMRLGYPVAPYISHAHGTDGSVAGVTIHF